MYLLIQNEGVAPPEAFYLLGDSGTRQRDNESLIGQFGSGNKLGIALLMRLRIPFRIYSGKTRLDFYTEPISIQEADGVVRTAHPVKVRLSGEKNRTIECGWTTDMGAMDWKDPIMALREFVSNCLDCSNIMETDPIIKPEASPRAKEGTTRIYVDMDHPAVQEFYSDLGKHFLHFSHDPSQVYEQFLRKSPDSTGPRIYREGVFVRELASNVPAAFDYNFLKGQIKIDEARNSSEYQLRATIAQLINQAPVNILEKFFERLSEGKIYEGTLDAFYLGYYETCGAKENWTKAWNNFAPDAAISNEVLGKSAVAEHARKKGHKVIPLLSDAFAKIAENMGVPNISTILGHEASGRIEVPATEAAQKAVDQVWSWVEVAGMTSGKTEPKVSSFKEIMSGESECLGFYRVGGDTVFIREDLDGKIALKTAIEEVAHYVTGSTDLSRDFQNYAFDMIVELCV